MWMVSRKMMVVVVVAAVGLLICVHQATQNHKRN